MIFDEEIGFDKEQKKLAIKVIKNNIRKYGTKPKGNKCGFCFLDYSAHDLGIPTCSGVIRGIIGRKKEKEIKSCSKARETMLKFVSMSNRIVKV